MLAKFIKNTAVLLVSVLVLFVGVLAICLVLSAITSDQFVDWSRKALFIAVILFVIGAVIGYITSLIPHKK